jgi:hypothetical protein
MKRILFITLCLVALALTATAQPNPHYADMYDASTNKLIGKQWMSGIHARLERIKDDGTSTIMIYRADSAVIYTLNPEKKVYMPLPMSQATDMNLLIGAKVEEGRSVTREFIGIEDVEGKQCAHYKVTIITMLANGTQSTGGHHEWFYEPLNTFIRYQPFGYGNAWILRNIRQEAQPANLFEIPRDYKAMNVLPAGGLMEMLQQSNGKSQADMQQGVNNANKDAKEKTDKLNEIKNNPNQTEQQKMQNALKMLEGLNKKKK